MTLYKTISVIIGAIAITLAGLSVLLIKTEYVEAKKTIVSATSTLQYPTEIVDFKQMFSRSSAGTCYKFPDVDGDGFTFVWFNDGAIFTGKTCE